jgi:signal transduction histidine kinase
VGGFQHQWRPQLAADGPLALQPRRRRTWLIWLITAGALSLAGAAAIARLINRPLKQLSYAANRVRDGDFAASRLDEEAVTSEIREVNIGFNRMAQKLAKLEQDRAVMLAGISHDLRTPLARLRLETEMSVWMKSHASTWWPTSCSLTPPSTSFLITHAPTTSRSPPSTCTA